MIDFDELKRDLLSFKQTCRLLGIGENRGRQILCPDLLERIRLGGVVFFRRSDIEAVADSRRFELRGGGNSPRIQKARANRVRSADLSILSERNRELVARRYGVNGFDVHSYAEISHHFGISRQRVQQIVVQCERNLIKAALGG